MVRDTGTVDEDVNSAKLADGFLHHGGYVVGYGDICFERDGSPTHFAHLLSRTQRIFNTEVTGCYIAAELREAEGDRLAKANSGASDERDATAKIDTVSRRYFFIIHDQCLEKLVAALVPFF